MADIDEDTTPDGIESTELSQDVLSLINNGLDF